MSIVTIDGEKVSTEQEPENWFYYRTDAFRRLREAVAIDDLRALVDHAVGVAAYAIIRGSPWDAETEAALETAKRAIMADLKGNEANCAAHEQYWEGRTKEMEHRPAATAETGSVIKFPAQDTITVTGYFGACPDCGRSEYVNVGREHWLICTEHKKRAPIGSNLFSDWRNETEADWERNRKLLSECEHVDFLPAGLWPKDPAARATALRRAREKAGREETHWLGVTFDDDISF
jgi:hypothetical protein